MKLIGTLASALALTVTLQTTEARAAPITDEERTIVQVFEAPGYSKDQIFSATKVWIAENFKSAKAVIA